MGAAYMYGVRGLAPMTLSPEYLAGVFDSDGSFTIQLPGKGNGWRGQVRITWKQSGLTREVFEEIQAEYGGSIYEGVGSTGFVNRFPYFIYQNHSKRALPLIEAILPYLRLKRRQAELVASLISRQRRGAHVRNLEERLAMRAEVMSLNSGKGKSREG